MVERFRVGYRVRLRQEGFIAHEPRDGAEILTPRTAFGMTGSVDGSVDGGAERLPRSLHCEPAEGAGSPVEMTGVAARCENWAHLREFLATELSRAGLSIKSRSRGPGSS